MKLLTKNTLVLLLVTLAVFAAGGVIFYFQLQIIFHEEATEALYFEKERIEAYAEKNNKLPETFNEVTINYKPVSTLPKDRLKDTIVYVQDEGESLPFKQLSFGIEVNEQKYVCTISKSLFEKDDLVETILNSLGFIAAVLIVVFLLVNYLFSKITWKPFFTSLEKINAYDVKHHKLYAKGNTKTKEFVQLEEAVYKMTEKISQDFNNVKSFSENASHELQTPLAIIKTKTELLLQSENLTEEQAGLIAGIDQTVNRLSKINQTLLLLSKIENNQFMSNETLDFSQTVKNKLDFYEDLIQMKQLKIDSSLEPVNITIHPSLADIIVSNLISNAIRYTKEEGAITIKLNTAKLEVSNSGTKLNAPEEQLFNRFYKENNDSESTGLGLALVKQAAGVSNHRVSYSFENNLHTFTYYFS